MAKNDQVLALLKQQGTALSVTQINEILVLDVSTRTIRRWLLAWAEQGLLSVSGHTKSRRYAYINTKTSVVKPQLEFMNKLDTDLQSVLLEQFRDLWAFTATGIQGSALQLQDCHALLSEGTTVADKAIEDHQQVLGFSHAIALIYQSLSQPLHTTWLLELHKTLLHEKQLEEDILTLPGHLRSSPMGSYTISDTDEQLYIEYAAVDDIAVLLDEWVCIANQLSDVGVGVEFDATINQSSAAKIYAKLHIAFVHIHPFAQANGLMARLLANIPLLKAGFPPLIIQPEKRREYIDLISHYQLNSGVLNKGGCLWPRPDLLQPFIEFCQQQYHYSLSLVDEVAIKQQHRQDSLFESQPPM